MHWFRALAVATATWLAAGCASMSEDECLLADWRTIGFEDGARGAAAETVGARREACADHGVVPDLDAYRSGRAEGLREYCRPERGFALGSSGSSYGGVCPPTLEPEFMDAYRSGARLATLRQALDAAARRVTDLEKDRDNLRAQRRDLEAELIAGATPAERRAIIIGELRDQEDRVSEVEAALEDARMEQIYRREELEAYQAQLAQRGY